MLKQRAFKALDLIIYFNIILFIATGIYALSSDIFMSIMFFVVSLFNLIFILYTIKLRIEYNKKFIEEIDKEINIENKMNQKNRDNYNRAKQVLLESRIESEIINKIEGVKVIRNAYIPRSNGDKSEVDLIAISSKGIFIIESKNLTGKIVGNWKQDSLKLEHPGGQVYPIPNPINQNTQHYYSLRAFLGINSDIFRSIIVLSDLCYVDSYKDVPYYAQVCHLNNLIFSMNNLSKRYNTTIEKHIVESIYENLLSLVEKTDEKEREHIERVQSN